MRPNRSATADLLPDEHTLRQLTPNERQKVVIEYGRRSLAAYTRLMMSGFERSRHHDQFFQLAQRLERGELDRAIICVPPRHSKSTVFTEMFPAWYLGKHPEHQVILTAYGQHLADTFGRKVRNHLKSPMHTAVFPKCQLSMDSKSVQRFGTTAGGVCMAVGRGGAITGHGGHLIIVDDPLKDRAEANSETIRENLKEWFSSVVYTRMMPGAKMLVVMTRWHEDDLVGHILREHMHDGWELFRLPAIAEEDEGWRKKGEALWPEWFPVDIPEGQPGNSLERFRKTLGSRDFNCLYQQRPVGAEGGSFKFEWLDNHQYRRVPTGPMNKLIIVDPATTKKKNSDFTAIICMGLAANRHVYVLDAIRDRLNLVERKEALFRMVDEWRPYVVAYEEYASRSDTEYLRECMDMEAFRFRIISVKGNQLRKEDRIERLVPWYEAGRIHWPQAMWRERIDGAEGDLVEEFRNEEYGVFPAGAHDDLLDAQSRLLDEQVPLHWPLDDAENASVVWDGTQRVSADGGSWMTQ